MTEKTVNIRWHSIREKPRQGEMALLICFMPESDMPTMTVGAFWEFTDWIIEGTTGAIVRYWTPLSALYDILEEQMGAESC